MADDFLTRARAQESLQVGDEDPFGPFTNDELIFLSKHGIDPKLVVSQRMLADLWGMSDESLRVFRHRNKDTNVPEPLIIGNCNYFRRSDILPNWKPPEPESAKEPAPIEVSGAVLRATEKKDKTTVTVLTAGGRKLRKLAYTQALVDTVTLDDWVAIVKRAVNEAKLGDVKARQWLSGYLIGLPVQRTELELSTSTDRFSEAQRKEALYQMLGGPDGTGVIDVGSSDPDSDEADGQAVDWQSSVDAASEQ